MDEYEWTLESKPDDRDRKFLSDRINEHGVAATGIDDGEGLIVGVRDGSGHSLQDSRDGPGAGAFTSSTCGSKRTCGVRGGAKG